MRKMYTEEIFDEIQKNRELIEYLKADKTLELLLTDNTVDNRSGHAWIYYRGGGLLKLTFNPNTKSLEVNADSKYTESLKRKSDKDDRDIDNMLIGENKISLAEAIKRIPLQKKAMDFHGTNREKEAMQQLVRENNDKDSAAIHTDYYIADMEYPITNGRLDGLALYWPPKRTSGNSCSLAIIEAKYGTSATGSGKQGGSATISAHIRDLYYHFCTQDDFDKKIDDMFINAKQVLMRKQALGLISFPGAAQFQSVKMKDKEYHYILALFNYHDMNSFSALKNELELAMSLKPDGADETAPTMFQELSDKGFQFYIAQSSFMGYGLYNNENCPMIKWNEWLRKR